MSIYGSVFKISSCMNAYKNFLNNGIIIAAPQPSADYKMPAKYRIDISDIPQKPKRPLTPYFKFIFEHRPLIKQQRPELSLTETVKVCAQEWKNVDPSVKEKYSETYKKEMEDYAKVYLDYQSKLSEDQKEKLSLAKRMKLKQKKQTKLRQKSKNLGKPKRPVAPYFKFLAEKAKERNQKYKDVLLSATNEWHQLSEVEKEKYKKGFSESLKTYKEEIQKWETDMIKAGNLDVVRTSSLIEPDLKKQKKGFDKMEPKQKPTKKQDDYY